MSGFRVKSATPQIQQFMADTPAAPQQPVLSSLLMPPSKNGQPTFLQQVLSTSAQSADSNRPKSGSDKGIAIRTVNGAVADYM